MRPYTAYRTIFKSWRFFATVTVTAFILLVLTVALGVICYLNYGKGLQAYRKHSSFAVAIKTLTPATFTPFLVQMTEELEGTDFDPVSGFKAGEKLPEKPFPASFYGYAPAFHEKSDAEWATPEALPEPPTAAEVNQYLSRTAAPPVVHQPQVAAASNPFESDMDAAADSRMKSVWSANTSDFDGRSLRTLTSPTSDVPPGFHLQPPPASRVGPQPRLPSFNGTLASLEPYAGMPALPITPPMATRERGR